MSPQPPPDSSSDHTDPWLTRKEAAAYAKLSTATLRRASDRGDLEVGRIPNGRSVRYRRSWIDSWLNGGGPHATIVVVALLLAGCLLACIFGLRICHVHWLLEQIEWRA